jgi:hypothetical protein
MRRLIWLGVLILLAGCSNDEQSWISIRNGTDLAIYALPYSSEFSNGAWIQPGSMDDFYSIECDCLDGFSYFSFYYDSLIIYLEGFDEQPVKFYKNGSAVNYDATLNPFTNPDVWKKREFNRYLPGSSLNTLEEKHIFEHYFSINAASVKSLSDTVRMDLHPAS